MTADEFISIYEDCSGDLRLPLSSKEAAAWATASEITPEGLDATASFLSAMAAKKHAEQIRTLKKLSRLPQKNPSSFRNFDLSLLNTEAKKQITALESLSFISAKRNIIMIGPPGTGKTHLAMAIGNACCESRMKAYFIKMDELKAKFHDALVSGNLGRLLNGLAKYSCLIIDEIGYCHFNRAETLAFFQLVDRISIKDSGSIVLTSNKDTSEWKELFDEDDALECSIDRLWDEAICFTFSGRSFRGQNQEIVSLDFMMLKDN